MISLLMTIDRLSTSDLKVIDFFSKPSESQTAVSSQFSESVKNFEHSHLVKQMEVVNLTNDIPFSVINRSWTDEQRRTVWCLICKARRGLQVELSPIIASAFVILQRYFRSSDDCQYELFILMAAALFTACKAADCYRPIQMVYAELSKICMSAPSTKIRSLVNERSEDFSLANPNDLIQITRAELDLLKAIDFDFDIDLPFSHFDRWKETLMSRIPNEEFMRICNSVIVDICLMLCSAFYLDVPPEVAAAAAAADSFGSDVIPSDTYEWLKNVREKYGDELFELAVGSIRQEKQKTAQFNRPPPRPQPH